MATIKNIHKLSLFLQIGNTAIIPNADKTDITKYKTDSFKTDTNEKYIGISINNNCRKLFLFKQTIILPRKYLLRL